MIGPRPYELGSMWSFHQTRRTPASEAMKPANPNASRYLATAPSAIVAWQATRHMAYSIIYTHFFTGDFFQVERPNRNVNYLAAWISYRF